MDTETVRQLVEILGTASGDAKGLLWAFVVKEYLAMFAEWAITLIVFWAIYRVAKFLVAKEVWKYI